VDVSIPTIPTILGTILFAASVSRFIRQSAVTEGLRLRLSECSVLLNKLISCPHCLCFWLALFCGAALARTWLQFFILVLLGWRGAYYLNRLVDRVAPRPSSRSARRHPCQVCGAPWNKDFLERQGMSFCSYRCWFDYLKQARQRDKPLFNAEGNFIRQEFFPVSFKNVDPAQARELLDRGQGYTYIDVRSVPEFENGHPAGAVNVPLFHRQPAGLVPNLDFLKVVETHFARDDKLLVGCQVGSRSICAAEALMTAGFTEVTSVQGGFSGARNQLGQVVTRGWLELGFPVEYGAGDEQSYAALAAKHGTTRRSNGL